MKLCNKLPKTFEIGFIVYFSEILVAPFKGSIYQVQNNRTDLFNSTLSFYNSTLTHSPSDFVNCRVASCSSSELQITKIFFIMTSESPFFLQSYTNIGTFRWFCGIFLLDLLMYFRSNIEKRYVLILIQTIGFIRFLSLTPWIRSRKR